MSKRIPVADRQTIFAALVSAQDRGQPVMESRNSVSRKYRVTEYTLKKIENEGIAREWPPLSSPPLSIFSGKVLAR